MLGIVGVNDARVNILLKGLESAGRHAVSCEYPQRFCVIKCDALAKEVLLKLGPWLKAFRTGNRLLGMVGISTKKLFDVPAFDRRNFRRRWRRLGSRGEAAAKPRRVAGAVFVILDELKRCF